MSLSLKHIPCPAGNNCTAFQCIFGHQHEREKPSAVVSSRTEQLKATTDAQQDGPRKRQRLDSPTPTAASPSNANEAKKQRLTVAKPSEEQLGQTLASARRPISPPPLRKPKHLTSPAVNGKQASAANESPRTSNTASFEKTGRTTISPSTQQAKKEALNPRLIKSGPPASHEIRLKLIKMLHQQLERLNTELKKDAKEDEEGFLLTAQELITRALDEEQQTATEKPALYSNLMKNKVMQFKRMTVGQWRDIRLKQTKQKGSETPNLPAQVGSDKSIEIETGLTASQEVE